MFFPAFQRNTFIKFFNRTVLAPSMNVNIVRMGVVQVDYYKGKAFIFFLPKLLKGFTQTTKATKTPIKTVVHIK